MSSTSALSRMLPVIALLLCAAAITLASRTTFERRDAPRTVIPIPGSPYVFTQGIDGCVNGPGGSFSYNWSFNTSLNNPFCGKGWAVGTGRTIQFSGTYVPNGNSKVTIFGWTRNPLTGYQVLEGYGTYNPASYATRRGNVTCDGRMYDVLSSTRYNQPTIDGTQTYEEFWSVDRIKWYGSTTPRTVNMDCHLKAWASYGMKVGSHDYQLVSVDSYYSGGTLTMNIA